VTLPDADDRKILEHYGSQAAKHGASPASTMEDEVIRAKEIELLGAFLAAATSTEPQRPMTILDLGCGNGFALETLGARFSEHRLRGLDFSTDMLAYARRRLPTTVPVVRGDARALPWATGTFDALYTERCLINLLTAEGQAAALAEIARVLAPGGHALLIEGFTDGLENNNRARTECGLEPLAAAHHNRYFEKGEFRAAVEPHFDLVDPVDWVPEAASRLASNFLSSHYFIARVLHPLVTKGPWVRNTEFVKFFAGMEPVGEYSPIQAFLLRRREE
jgi:ubiquinone/menaquinone biosynthesis C-methylase UbiE